MHEDIARYFRSPDTQIQLTAMRAFIDIKAPDEMRQHLPAEITKRAKVATDTKMPRAQG